MAPPASPAAEDRTALAQQFIEALVDGSAVGRSTFDSTALKGLRAVEVSAGRVVAEMDVGNSASNRYGTLHGGCTASLVDVVSTAALLTTSPHSGVSVHLAVTYHAAMPCTCTTTSDDRGVTAQQQETVVVDARVTKVGRTLASIVVDLRRKATGQLVASGTHTKYLFAPDLKRGVGRSKL